MSKVIKNVFYLNLHCSNDALHTHITTRNFQMLDTSCFAILENK